MNNKIISTSNNISKLKGILNSEEANVYYTVVKITLPVSKEPSDFNINETLNHWLAEPLLDDFRPGYTLFNINLNKNTDEYYVYDSILDYKKDGTKVNGRQRFLELLFGLEKNAYQSKGGCANKIRIRTELSRDKKSITILFMDNGTGVDVDRANESLNTPYSDNPNIKGLTIAKEDIQRLGGTIEIISRHNPYIRLLNQYPD